MHWEVCETQELQKIEEHTIKKPDRKTTQPNARVIYEKNFGQRIGTKGEEKLRVEVDPVKNKIILLSDKSISSKDTLCLFIGQQWFL